MRVLALLSLLLAYAGCDSMDSRADITQMSQTPEALIGTWEWERDSYYWTGSRESQTPRNTERTETLTFRADGSVTIRRSEEAALETTWTLARREGTLPELVLAEYRTYVFGVDGRTLVMFVANLGDGPERVFRRQD